MIPSTKVYENRPTLFANNWDRFGGRALDILNCFYVAQKLQINFKFFWPYNSFFKQNDPHIQFFSQEFRDMYRVETDLDPGSKQLIDFNQYTFSDAKDLVASIDSKAKIGIANFFALPRFLDEIEENCITEYAACAHSVIAPGVRNANDEVVNSTPDWITIHGRYGDLINGDFKQYVPQTKYVNTLVYRNFIEKSKGSETEIKFLSDSISVVEGLEQISKCDLKNHYNSQLLHEIFGRDYRDFSDILIMANSKYILAPQSSAYSILASRIGGIKIFDLQTSQDKKFISKISGINIDRHYEFFGGHIREALKARDLQNFLQNHHKSLSFSNIRKLSYSSYASDGNYVYGACTWSAIQYLLGNENDAKTILARAEHAARSVMHVHHDPLAVVLVAKFCFSRFGTNESNDSILEELDSLKTYQFSTIIAMGYLETWVKALEQRRINRENIILRTTNLVYPRLKNVTLRKFRLSWIWRTAQHDNQNEFLFGILNLLSKI